MIKTGKHQCIAITFLCCFGTAKLDIAYSEANDREWILIGMSKLDLVYVAETEYKNVLCRYWSATCSLYHLSDGIGMGFRKDI